VWGRERTGIPVYVLLAWVRSSASGKKHPTADGMLETAEDLRCECSLTGCHSPVIKQGPSRCRTAAWYRAVPWRPFAYRSL